MPSKSVSLVIPAFREVGTIGQIVKTAIASGLFLEVIVVDDGSDDDTAILATNAGADVIILTKNCGKGVATREGCYRARGDLIMCWDADLAQTTADSFQTLLNLSDEFDLVIGFLPEISQSLVKSWSGQRLISRHLLDNFFRANPEIEGFGIDGRLVKWAKYQYVGKRQLKIGFVELSGIRHIRKCAKFGLLKGLWRYIKMWWEVSWGK